MSAIYCHETTFNELYAGGPSLKGLVGPILKGSVWLRYTRMGHMGSVPEDLMIPKI